MSTIDWQDTVELKPREYFLESFCLRNNLSYKEIRKNQGTLAFIEKRALESLHDFLSHDTQREHGGVLVGESFYDPIENRYFAVIRTAIPALESEGSSVHLQFTSDTWKFISGLIEDEFPTLTIIGWYHSHPGLGVFMSATDRATQKAFYNHPWNLAVVVDPIAQKTGWFYGSDCETLDYHDVYAYTEPLSTEPIIPSPAVEISPLEDEYRQRYHFKNLRWLLPFGILIGPILVGVWYFSRNRI